jgi:hypothetical protein
MSIVVRFSPVGLTAAKYDAVSERIQNAVEWPPDGMDHHLCFGSDGNLRVSEVWDSREQLEAFGKQLMPILEDEGIQMAGEPEVFEVHNAERR